LINNQVKFRQYFRINYEQFNFLLSLVEEKLSVESTNRVKNPIGITGRKTRQRDNKVLIILKLKFIGI